MLHELAHRHVVSLWSLVITRARVCVCVYVCVCVCVCVCIRTYIQTYIYTYIHTSLDFLKRKNCCFLASAQVIIISNTLNGLLEIINMSFFKFKEGHVADTFKNIDQQLRVLAIPSTKPWLKSSSNVPLYMQYNHPGCKSAVVWHRYPGLLVFTMGVVGGWVGMRRVGGSGGTRQGRGLLLLLCLLCLLTCVKATSTRLTACNGGCCRVEVYYDGEWGTVCDDYFGDVDAGVVCREVGYLGTGARYVPEFGSGSGRIWMSEIACSGSESGLAECGHRGWGSHNCVHDEDVGVCCLCPGSSLTESCRCAPGTYSSGVYRARESARERERLFREKESARVQYVCMYLHAHTRVYDSAISQRGRER